jgi:hypothetical protein
MTRNRKTYLTFTNPDSDLHELNVLWTAKANRAARRDADLARRKVQRDRKVALQDRTFLSTKGQ